MIDTNEAYWFCRQIMIIGACSASISRNLALTNLY